MSGLFTSIDSMPDWAKVIAYSNPVTYFIEVLRMIVLKGSGFADIKKHFLVMIGFAVLFFVLILGQVLIAGSYAGCVSDLGGEADTFLILQIAA